MASNHMASVRDNTLPAHPEKLIFAVDLVHFVMATRWPEYASLPRHVEDVERYRETVYNAFTGDIRNAVEHLVGEMADEIESRFSAYLQNNTEIDEQSFIRMAEDYANEFSVTGDLSMRNLLRYFVCLGLLAGHYYAKNVTKATHLASNFIQFRLPIRFFENSEFWDELNANARIILGIEEEQRPADPPNLNADEYQEHPSPRNIPDEPFM